MKRFIYVLALVSVTCFSQKSTQKGMYEAKNGDTILSSNTRYDKAFVAGLVYSIENNVEEYEIKQPRHIVNIKDLLDKLKTTSSIATNYKAPSVDSISVDGNVNVLHIYQDEDFDQPIFYQVVINDTLIYNNVKFDTDLPVKLFANMPNKLRVIPIYHPVNDSLSSNEIIIKQ